MAEMKELVGKIIERIDGLEIGSDSVTFVCGDGSEYCLYHQQDCCESVDVEDICGDPSDLLNSPVLSAEESSSHENPEGKIVGYQESFTWTFYKIDTAKGGVTIRWYGSSNGYYGERATFVKTK